MKTAFFHSLTSRLLYAPLDEAGLYKLKMLGVVMVLILLLSFVSHRNKR